MSGLIKSLPWREPEEKLTEELEIRTRRLCSSMIDFEARTNLTSPYFSHLIIKRSIAITLIGSLVDETPSVAATAGL